MYAIDSQFSVVVPPHEPYGVQRAAKDLLSDIRAVSGLELRLHPSVPAEAKRAIVIESDRAIASRLGFAAQIDQPETFLHRRVRLDGERDVLLISGNGERGAIYGIYHFSQAHLGTDPFQFWTGYVPPQRNPLMLNDEAIDYVSPPPCFRFRGFHLERISDIAGWGLISNFGDLDGSVGWHLYWERVFETILRAKGNMVKPGDCYGRPDALETVLAQQMGLNITTEHFAPLGVALREVIKANPSFDPSFRRNRAGFVELWEASIQRYARPENVIWTVGLRGAGDQPFWFDDPEADTDAKRGAIVSDAIATQVDIVKRRFGHLKPVFIHNLWMEGVRMFRDGHVRLPDDVHPVWADNGYGTFRSAIAAGTIKTDGTIPISDALPESNAGGKHGVYCHVSMYDMCAPDLAQFVPPERIQQEVRRAMKKETTAYLLVNVGRVREQVLGAQAVMEAAWGRNTWDDFNVDAAEDYWDRWCRRHFGDAHANAARACYRDLYEIPFRWGRWGGWDDYILGEMGHYRIARELVHESLNAKQKRNRESMPWKFFMNRAMSFAEQIAFVRESIVGATEPKWTAARQRAIALLEKLDGQPKQFFDENVVAQIEIYLFSSRYLSHVVEGVAHYDAGKLREAAVEFRAAQDAMRDVRAAMRRMEHGRWAGWNKTNYWAGLEIADDSCTAMLTTIELLTKPRRG